MARCFGSIGSTAPAVLSSMGSIRFGSGKTKVKFTTIKTEKYVRGNDLLKGGILYAPYSNPITSILDMFPMAPIPRDNTEGNRW